MKSKHVPIYGGYSGDSEFFKMGYNEFVDYCGGLLAVSLFKGRFSSDLYMVINMAVARGIKQKTEEETE